MIARERRILSGRGLFIDNMELPLMAHCVFVGSPHAHARIRNIDCESALRIPGVLTVITGEEMVKKTNPLPPNADFARKGWTWRSPTVYPLAVGKARFHGEPVAAVIADHPAAAIEAANRLGVEYEPLPHVLDATEAMKKGAPLLYEEWGDNIQMQGTFNYGRVDQAFAEADRTVAVVWREARCSGFPIEARGCLAAYDPLSQTLNAWGTYQCPFRAQYGISHVLRVPLNQVRVVASDIGGAFGNKINSWKSSVVCFAAMKIQRPVKWIESTREFILSGPHQRDVFWDGEAAFQKDGRILGVKARFIQDLGVEVSHRDFAGPSIHAACASVPNAYRLKGVRIDALGVVTNKSHYGAYRGYGKDKGIKFMERIMDRVAQECRVDPAEIRRLNFIRAEEFPYRQISGLVYDSGNYIALLDRAVQLAEVDKWRKLQEEGRRRGRCIGVGIAFVVEPAGVAAPNERYSGMVQARIRLTPDGLVEVYSDRTEIGQGAERSNAIAVAEILGCRLDDVVVKPVTSDMAGMGPVSSRGSVHCLSAIARAAKEIRSMIVACAAAFLEEEPGHLELKEGVVFSTRSPDRRMTYKDLAERLYFRPGSRGFPKQMQQNHAVLPDITTSWFSPNAAENPTTNYTTFSSSADVAVVEIDPETGETGILKMVHVHDSGRIVSREMVDGQIHGGIVQGIGEALSEEIRYNGSGQLENASYGDYVMPTAPDSPRMVIDHLETPSPFTELGTKGMGEAPIISGKAVMVSAVEDALKPFHVRIAETPLTREKLRTRILRSQGRGPV